MTSMNALTKRQQQVLDFIQRHQQAKGHSPSLREIAAHFGFNSMNAALDHVGALRRKGFLIHEAGCARAHRVVSPLDEFRSRVVDIPVLGSIPAGFTEDLRQEAKGCISVDVETLGIKPTARTFALQVRGDSMIGKHIVEGDFVICEHGLTPHTGDVVAALIDNESTLKTFVMDRGKPWLRAENPRYPKLIPATELVIQGVMVGLIRKRK
ncbi:MAG TPA: transcriptional repressor LexA [Verrucomicrobiae bacterium]|nr:transcriptional repressor LexA [Verrucomicrobiae bacterium]